MKVFLTMALNAAFVVCFAQRQLDFGEIKQPNNRTTAIRRDKSICNSGFQLEISLTRAWHLMGRYENVSLTFDGFKWSAVKLKGNWIDEKTDTVAVFPVLNYDTLFTALKSNNVFLLDDQDLLQLKGTVDDGTEYSLSYKVGGHCRSYQFHNPEEYKLMNQDVSALTSYINIVYLLFEGLREPNSANTGLVK